MTRRKIWEPEENENNTWADADVLKYACFHRNRDILYIKHVLVFKDAWKSNEECDYMRQETLSWTITIIISLIKVKRRKKWVVTEQSKPPGFGQLVTDLYQSEDIMLFCHPFTRGPSLSHTQSQTAFSYILTWCCCWVGQKIVGTNADIYTVIYADMCIQHTLQ